MSKKEADQRYRGFTPVVAVVALTVISLVFGSLYFIERYKTSQNSILPELQKKLNVATRLQTPFPFQDLTIPYLRDRLYQSELGELEKVSENVNYTNYFTSYDSEGFKVYGQLAIPKGNPPTSGYPAIIFIHGYIPPEEYQTIVNYSSYVDYMVKNGLIVFKIDLRGHDESEGEAGGAYYSGDYVIDTLNAVAAIKKLRDPSNSLRSIVDADRIGLWGHSMAGNVVFRSFVASDEISKVVIWAGAGYTYSDLQDFRIQDNSYRPPPPGTERARKRTELRNLYGDFNPEDEFWKQVPGTNYLEGVVGQIQLHHATNDNVVSIDYSRNLMSILDNTQIEHELFEYSSGGHNLTGTSFTEAMQRSADFFKN